MTALRSEHSLDPEPVDCLTFGGSSGGGGTRHLKVERVISKSIRRDSQPGAGQNRGRTTSL